VHSPDVIKFKNGSGHGCWPKEMQMVKDEFKRWCGLPRVQGTIDGFILLLQNQLGLSLHVTNTLKQEITT
jgi:hypothetical protein